jgi:fumarate hydratase subunit beta
VHSFSTPITDIDVNKLRAGDTVTVSGYIYCGRDAVLPKIVQLYSEDRLAESDIDLVGSLIFHSAVSQAGIGPTSSNKMQIEANIPPLSQAGVKIHLGKGKISQETVEELHRYNSIFAVVPPVTALLMNSVIETKLIAFPEEGMEAFYRLQVEKLPMIVAAAHGETIFKD